MRQLKKIVNIDKNIIESWAKNRTARHTQVSETIRQGFKIRNDGTKILVNSIKEIYKFRDWAIHPLSNTDIPVLRKDLDLGVE